MAAAIEYFFDFSSPYGYLASHRIDDIAAKHGREVVWRPFLLGKVFEFNGQRPLTSQPLKGEYAIHDFARIARLYDIPWTMPEKFPIATQAAGRVFYWLNESDPGQAKTFAKLAYNTYFADGITIQAKDVVAGIAGKAGADEAAALAVIDEDRVKLLLLDASDEAIERNVCGSPFFFVDGEPFWGADRIEMIDQWLSTGGW